MKEDGAIIISLVMVILSIIMAIGVGINSILIRQLLEMQVTENSVRAFYGASSGIEKSLLYDRHNPYPESGDIEYKPGDLVAFETEECTHPDYDFCLKGTGIYQKSRRSLRVFY